MDKQVNTREISTENNSVASVRSTDKFWIFIEKQTGCAVPKYLQNILRLCGFDDAQSIKTLTAADSKHLEEFAKTKMKKFIPLGANLENFYHIFSSEPNQFEILLGHLRLLEEVVKYINVMTASHGPGFFDMNLDMNTKQDSSQNLLRRSQWCSDKFQVTPRNSSVHSAHSATSLSTSVQAQYRAQSIDEEKSLLFKIKKVMLQHIPDILKQMPELSKLINVQVHKSVENGEMFYVTTIKCPLCEIAFEAIKKVLPYCDNDICDDLGDDFEDDIFNQMPCTNSWTHSSFVCHIKRCYDSNNSKRKSSGASSSGTSSQKRKFEDISLTDKQLNESNPHFLLNSLVRTTEQNYGRKKPGFRHDDILKMFAAYTKMLGGTLLYDTLHANLPYSLLSPSKVDDFLSEKGSTITEGVLRATELKEHLTKRNLELKVWLSEDGTRITPKICYDSSINQLVGFNLPLDKHGMPITNTYMARNANEIESHFLNDSNSVSSTAYTIMASSLSEAQPPFCLTLFGTNNKFTFKDVLRRWYYIKDQLKDKGISTYGNSSDGDSRCLKAMKIASRIGQRTEDFACEWYSSGDMSWFQSKHQSISNSIYTSIYIQDTMHIATKFRNRLTKNSKIYPIGDSVVSNGHFKYLIHNVPKDKHLLNYTDIQPKDRQNFPSAEKICSINSQNCLKQFVPGSEGTVMYLKIMHYATTPFLEPKMTVVERIRRMWYAVFSLRIWRSWLIQTDGTTLTNNFISTNLYTSVEINAHSLIKYITMLRENNEPHLMLPLLLSSQPCESTFRQLRSMTSTFSTVVVLPLYDILFRIKRIQLMSDIVTACSGMLKFPRIENRKPRMMIPSELPKNEVIIEIIKNVRKEAVADMTVFGIDEDKMNTKCQVQSAYEDENEDDEDKDEDENEEDSDGDEFHIGGEDFETSIEIDDDVNNVDGVPEDILQNQKKLVSMSGSLSMKDYSKEYPNIDERSRFAVVVNDAGKESVLRKTSLCWLLQTHKAKSSSDRLQRVKEDEWNKRPNSKYER